MNFAPAPRMRDPELAAWTSLRFARGPLTLAEIVLGPGCGQPASSLSSTIGLLNRWRGAGLIEVVGKPESYVMLQEAKALRDPPAVGETAREPKPRSTRQRIWSAVRVMKSFDLVEICFAATVEKCAARRVLNQLTRAGYLARVDRRDDDHPRWRLIRPSGPRHPSVEYAGRTVVALVDRNSGQRFPLSQTQNFLTSGVYHAR